MASRMDKYSADSARPTRSRSQKNEHLYEQIYTNKVFTEFTEVENNNAIDLSTVSQGSSLNRREEFQRNRVLNSEMNSRRGFSTDTINVINDKETPMDKNYNINDILDEARKNRTSLDDSEKKRHLKTVEYNILSDLSQEKLKEYREKKQKLSKDEEENLEELIHTITSNSLRKKIDDELLSDLLPSEESETLVSKQLLEEIEKANTANNVINTVVEEDTTEHEIDKSFYTKSMDLSEEDFDFDEEEEDRSFLEDAKMSTSKKILITLFVLVVLGVIGFIIYRFI